MRVAVKPLPLPAHQGWPTAPQGPGAGNSRPVVVLLFGERCLIRCQERPAETQGHGMKGRPVFSVLPPTIHLRRASTSPPASSSTPSEW